MISPSPGMSSPAGDDALVADCELARRLLDDRAVGLPHPGDRLGARLAQRVGLGLAAALGHRLGEVREQHGEPQPRGDETREHAVGRGRRRQLLEEQDRREDAADLDDEHHRVARHLPRVELHERVADRPPHDRGVEQRRAPDGRVRTFGGRGRRLGCRELGDVGVVVTIAPQNLPDEVLDDGAERDDREVRQPDDDHDDAGEQRREQRRVRRERAGRRRCRVACARASRRSRAPGSSAGTGRRASRARRSMLNQFGVAGEAGERRAVVVGLRGERVGHLGEPVRPGVARASSASVCITTEMPVKREDRRAARRGCRARRASSRRPGSSCRGTPAFARPSGPAMNTDEQREQQHAVEAGAGAARDRPRRA